jgi:uncharacterized protein (TIGR03067 family)
MRTRIALAVIVGFLVAADAAKDEAAKESKKLEGVWIVTAFEKDGNRIAGDDTKEWKLVVKGDKYTMTIGDQVEEGTFKLNPSQPLKTVDLMPTSGEAAGKTRLGIYELKGDTAKACFASVDKKERPKEFATKADVEDYLWEFQRDKAGTNP